MRHMAVKILHDEELAADAVQETLARLWHRRWKLGLIKNPQGFCMTSLRNYCIDTLRRQKNINTIESDPSKLIDYQPTENPGWATEARYNRLAEAINSLPTQQQRLIKLKYVEQYSSQEIAQLTGMSVSNVNTTMSRIYSQLRKQLDEKE